LQESPKEVEINDGVSVKKPEKKDRYKNFEEKVQDLPIMDKSKSLSETEKPEPKLAIPETKALSSNFSLLPDPMYNDQSVETKVQFPISEPQLQPKINLL
jgi:hypothetical protein